MCVGAFLFFAISIMMEEMKQLLLIDANALVHRAFHALPPFTTPRGAPIGAIYGLASIMIRIFREDPPDYAAALFDRPEPTFREKEYKAYKAQRPPAADELISQIIEAHRFFTEFGIPVFEKPGYEADDLIATFAERFGKEKDVRVVILTGDMDALQLVRGNKVVVRALKTGISDTMLYDEEAVIARYGFPPDKIVEYKAFTGDASDNIKGVPGVGPKTATALVQKYGTLENIYAHVADDPKIEKKIGPFKEEAFFSRRLNTLDREVPIEAALSDLAFREDKEKMINYSSEMGFKKIVERLSGAESEAKEKKKPEKKEVKSPQGTMFS